MRKRASLFLLAFLLIQCGKVAATQVDDTMHDDASATDASSDGGTPSPKSGADAAPSSDASDGSALDAEAPAVSCADDASICDNLPPSVCADIKTLVYFSNGSCVGGTCTWTKTAMSCGFQSSCFQNGCTPPTTK